MPTVTEVDGVPLIVGARLVALDEVTRIENAGSFELIRPSQAETMIFDQVPVDFGVPVKTPVFASNVAHEGRF